MMFLFLLFLEHLLWSPDVPDQFRDGSAVAMRATCLGNRIRSVFPKLVHGATGQGRVFDKELRNVHGMYHICAYFIQGLIECWKGD